MNTVFTNLTHEAITKTFPASLSKDVKLTRPDYNEVADKISKGVWQITFYKRDKSRRSIICTREFNTLKEHSLKFGFLTPSFHEPDGYLKVWDLEVKDLNSTHTNIEGKTNYGQQCWKKVNCDTIVNITYICDLEDWKG